MNNPAHLKYTPSHEWINQEADGTLTVGITDHAQDALGDLVFVELPAIGRQLIAGEACVVLESVKAASDAYAPVAGEVIAVNQAVADKPESLNENAYDAWLFKLKPAAGESLDAMLDAAGYAASVGDA
ncbi:MAG: glycine cleavage system protein GcvH [Betaproteobacteria bacterium]|nr:glycine cleavage system protein GcvH [Betaproteobacteria bacterium]